MQCQEVGTGVESHESGQSVTCSVKDGFQCKDSDNGGMPGVCKNYQIRFYCQCSEGMIISPLHLLLPTLLHTFFLLPFPSLPFPSLPFPSLPFPSPPSPHPVPSSSFFIRLPLRSAFSFSAENILGLFALQRRPHRRLVFSRRPLQCLWLCLTPQLHSQPLSGKSPVLTPVAYHSKCYDTLLIYETVHSAIFTTQKHVAAWGFSKKIQGNFLIIILLANWSNT